jgi:hypothetical protein
MTGTDLCVNKPQSVPVIFEPPCISVSQSVCYTEHYMFRSWLTIIHTTQTSYIGKHATHRKIHFTKNNHGAIHPRYTKYSYSQKSINRCVLTSSDHIGVVHNFQVLHTSIFRSACIYIRWTHGRQIEDISTTLHEHTNCM